MKRLDRYVAGLFLRGLALFGPACAALYVTVDFFEQIDRVVETFSMERLAAAARYYALQLPLIGHYLLPAVALLAAVAAVATLRASGELTAIQSSGISLRRLFATFHATGWLLAAFSFANQEWLLPAVSGPLREAEETFKKGPERREVVTRFPNPPVVHDRRGWFVQMGVYDASARAGERVTAIQREGDLRRILTAERATYDAARGAWRVESGRRQIWEPDRPEIRTEPFSTGPEGIVWETEITPEQILGRRTEAALLPRSELRERIQEHRGIASLRVQYYQRLAAPLAAWLLPACGLPLFLAGRGASFAAGILFTILAAGLFFFLQVVCAVLGGQRVLTPQAAAFLPPAALAAAAALAWARVRT